MGTKVGRDSSAESCWLSVACGEGEGRGHLILHFL